MKKRKYLIIFLSALILIFVILVSGFKMQEIVISGNEIMSQEEIIDAINDNIKIDNTIYFYIKNKISPSLDLPFVSKIEVEIINRNKISVVVYEKKISGCIEYMDRYVYFDKDGVVLETNNNVILGVPCIRGLEFSSWEIGEKLPIDNRETFKKILSITQLIEKYQLIISGIKFTSNNEIILYHEEIVILLGEGENLEIQFMNLGSILEGLKGQKGSLNMIDFSSENDTASFSN